jgi:hypothetical protein
MVLAWGEKLRLRISFHYTLEANLEVCTPRLTWSSSTNSSALMLERLFYCTVVFPDGDPG